MVNVCLKVSGKLFESTGIEERRYDRNEHRGLICPAVRVNQQQINAAGLLLVCIGDPYFGRDERFFARDTRFYGRHCRPALRKNRSVPYRQNNNR